MDISWAEQHLGSEHPDVNLRLQRVQQSLSAGVDLKRRIIEELRPSLLDNVGLFAALRWQLKVTCATAGIKCVESYPDEEPRLTSESAIALFRVAQEAFTNIVKHSEAKTVDVALFVDGDGLVMKISDDGKGVSAAQLTALGSNGLASMRHRVRALSGRLDIRSTPAGGTTVLVRIPAETEPA
jgi:signal transduction histidine kinase